jgi:uncharacterized protein with HEPN domain
MPRDYKVYLDDILQAITKTHEYKSAPLGGVIM